MLTSEKAIEKLKEELVTRVSKVGIGFRVYQEKEAAGAEKLALKLDRKSPEDETILLHGVSVFIDPRYSVKLKNLELDYIEGPSGGFILKEKNNG